MGAFLIALLPLISVIWTVMVNGIPGLLNPGFLGTSMNGVTGVFDNRAAEGTGPVVGGIYHALVGTVQITLLATVISVPVGLLTAIYLVEYGNDRPLARAITFFVDVMTGIPSIVAGLFAADVHLHADPEPNVAGQPGPVLPTGLGRCPGADHPGDDPQPGRPADRPGLRPQDGPLTAVPGTRHLPPLPAGT